MDEFIPNKQQQNKKQISDQFFRISVNNCQPLDCIWFRRKLKSAFTLRRGNGVRKFGGWPELPGRSNVDKSVSKMSLPANPTVSLLSRACLFKILYLSLCEYIWSNLSSDRRKSLILLILCNLLLANVLNCKYLRSTFLSLMRPFCLAEGCECTDNTQTNIMTT